MSTETETRDDSASGWMGAALRVVVGLFVGVVVGVALTLGLVVARAVVWSVYLHSFHDLVGWLSLPLVLAPVAGVWLAVRGGEPFRRGLVGVLVGLAAGTAVGVAAGWLVTDEPSGPWAGGVLGGALGLGIGFMAGVLSLFRRRKRRGSRSTATATASVALAALALSPVACDGGPEPTLEPVERELPSADGVRAAVLFVGDPGMARLETHPLLSRARAEVERWSAALPDSSVAVVVLGDIVYPDGLSPRESELWATDSARVAAQVAMVGGTEARAAGSRGLFVAGNHDWGQEEDWEGAVRLVRLAELLGRFRDEGVAVSLEPAAGTGGPTEVDVGGEGGVRLLLLDTAWWLLEGDPAARETVARAVRQAMADAGDRPVAVAAHHPFASAGPHGALRALGGTLGIRTLLARSGAMLQDLSSRPYRELRSALLSGFASVRAPELFAGGHEHSLQVFEHIGPSYPSASLVSGSASKLTDVGRAPGLVWARGVPGYARLLVLDDGTLHLSVEAAPPEHMSCPEGDRECLERGVEAYRTVWMGEVERAGGGP